MKGADMPEDELMLRTFDLADFQIRTDGAPGRIVDAYASVFDTPYEVWDWEDGRYLEVFKRGAFKKTLSEHRSKGFRKLKVLFNHAKDIYGWPADRFSMPIGSPIEVKEDAKGLFTSTRYADSELAAEVLDHIAADPPRIDSMSFSFRSIQKKRIDPPKGTNQLPTVERIEVDIREYGPCIFPANAAAEVVGVRMLADQLRRLDPAQLDELLKQIRQEAPPDTGPDPSNRQIPPEDGPDLAMQHIHLEHELTQRRLRIQETLT